jgi:HemY protein
MTRALHARRDPAWTADGFVSDRWMPMSPVSGRLDAFQWKAPVAALEAQGALIESGEKARMMIDAPPPSAPEPPPVVVPPVVPAPVVEAEPSEPIPSPPLAETPSARRARLRPAESAQPSVEKVIPLIPLPDDPGPHAHVDPEVEPPSDDSADPWQKLRGLFK